MENQILTLKKLWDSISANMVNATDGRPRQLLYGGNWQSLQDSAYSLLELFNVIGAPSIPVNISLENCEQVLYRPNLWQISWVVFFCQKADALLSKPVLDWIRIMWRRQVGPKYILISTMIFVDEWHHALFYTLLQVNVLVDRLFARRNVDLTNAFWRYDYPTKYFFFEFGLFPVGDVRRC